jgi:AcrR family transcriptional regulator
MNVPARPPAPRCAAASVPAPESTPAPAAARPASAGGLVWFDEPAPPRATEQLSRERIVTAAIGLADREARGEITMRAVAAALGARSPMALYRYVGSKDGLADLMVDQVYGLVVVPRGQGWRPALHGLGRTAWDAVQRHPWFARLAFSRPPLGPGALGLYDAALAELEPLPLDAATRMGFISTVLGHVLGSGLALLEEQAMRARTGLPTDDDLGRAAAPYLERIAAAGTYPHFSRWAADPQRDAAPFPRFEQILDWLLDGLADTLTPGG